MGDPRPTNSVSYWIPDPHPPEIMQHAAYLPEDDLRDRLNKLIGPQLRQLVLSMCIAPEHMKGLIEEQLDYTEEKESRRKKREDPPSLGLRIQQYPQRKLILLVEWIVNSDPSKSLLHTILQLLDIFEAQNKMVLELS